MPGASGGSVTLALDAPARTRVEELRRAAYLRAAEFYVDDARAYRWSADDDRSDVMVAWSASGDALATMRGAVARDRAEAEARFECAVDVAEACFPALLLERGATTRGHGGAGLNSLLRYHFLVGAQEAGAASVLGAVFDGAPRLHLLAELGYDFHEPARTWDVSLRSRTRLVIVTLPRRRLDGAVDILRDRFGALIADHPWHGAWLRFAVATDGASGPDRRPLSSGRAAP